MKVLLVDDDAAILGMMSRLLASRGHSVETCRGPFGASAQALRSAPELILLDVNMPALDGISLSKVLEKAPLDPQPIVVLWSSDDDALERVARETGLPALSKRSNPIGIIEKLERLRAVER